MQNKRSKWKNQFEQIDSSSNFHERIRKIFAENEPFKNFSCFQEVPVSALVSTYNNNYHCIDWYIDELATVVELHGAQHYKIVNFGNESFDTAKKKFYNIKYRDNKKRQALIDAGYEYREISYKIENKLNANLLKEIVFNY